MYISWRTGLGQVSPIIVHSPNKSRNTVSQITHGKEINLVHSLKPIQSQYSMNDGELGIDLKEEALHKCIGDIEFEGIFPMKLGIPCMPCANVQESLNRKRRLGPLVWIINTLVSSTC